MALSQEQIERIAKLARLGLNETEKERFCAQLSSILEYVGKLQEAKAPEDELVKTKLESGRTREDAARPVSEETRQLILKNMPSRKDDLLKTKGVFESQH